MAVSCEKFTKKNIDKLFKKPALSASANTSISASKNTKTKEKPIPSHNIQTIPSADISEGLKEDKKE